MTDTAVVARIDYPSSWSQADRDALDNMFIQARREEKWFFYGGLQGPMWFSPDELQRSQEQRHFVWGAVNWQLRAPYGMITEIDDQIAALQIKRSEVINRIRDSLR